MGEHLFNGLVVAVGCNTDPEDTRGVVTITTEDIGDLVMGERVTVAVRRAREATDGQVEAERDALRSVVRRYRDGWTDLPFGRGEVRWCREGPTVDRPDLIRQWQPMTPAEREAVRAALDATEATDA